MEDIEMKEANANKENEGKVTSPIYKDFIHTLSSILKNVSLKDLKT